MNRLEPSYTPVFWRILIPASVPPLISESQTIPPNSPGRDPVGSMALLTIAIDPLKGIFMIGVHLNRPVTEPSGTLKLSLTTAGYGIESEGEGGGAVAGTLTLGVVAEFP